MKHCITMRTSSLGSRNTVPLRAPVMLQHHMSHRRSVGRLIVAHAGHPGSVKAPEDQTFMDELRSYAMKLHTREQAPREGQAETPKEQPPWVPTTEGYYRFLIESKVVYDTFEDIFSNGKVPYFKEFVGTGLERGPALTKDIEYMTSHFNLTPVSAAADGPGHEYAALLRKLADENPSALMCHYYNYYFAHTAGGRMIGSQVSKAALGDWMGDFYKWNGNVKELLNAVREKLNKVAEGWSQEEKNACLEETMATFKWSGSLLRLITGGAAGGH